jgi:hypothetical protein
MLVEVRNHFNLRPLCKVELDDATIATLTTPPPLTQKLVKEQRIDPQTGVAMPVIVVEFNSENHVVELPTASGKLILFKIQSGGQAYVVTPTPGVAIANAA